MGPQLPFRTGFLWSSLSLALFSGFAIGAHVAYVIGFDHPLGPGFQAYIQTHGHVQIFGFAGLLIMGVALHFVPRLTGVPPAGTRPATRIFWLVTLSLWTRSLIHSFSPYAGTGAALQLFNAILATAGASALIGAGLFAWTLFSQLRRRGLTKSGAGAFTVKPFFLMMIAGFLIYSGLQSALLFHMYRRGGVTLHAGWNHFSVQLFIHFSLLPVAFAFSLKTLPLFLRLPGVTWPVHGFAAAYFASALLQLIPASPFFSGGDPRCPLMFSGFGQSLKGLLILLFIVRLDVLTRIRKPWTEAREFAPSEERRPTRPGLPDYGEYGRFELLIRSAYAWLALAALGDLWTGIAFALRLPGGLPADALRHLYLAGFIAPLIFGMSVRMLPGFMGKAGVWSPKLVSVSFYLITAAATGRVVPLLAPDFVYERISFAVTAAQAAFGLSGIVAMAAVAVLWVNLGGTARAEFPGRFKN